MDSVATTVETPTPTTVVYPDSDGQPMADNTKQFRWIVTIQGSLDSMFANQPDVFVAGDLLWYPVEGDTKTRVAPDAMVVFGRPKGDRGSYQQWREGSIAPQVVFEVLSPGNTFREMASKLLFYERFAVEEYYVYDPDRNDLDGWLRQDDRLRQVEQLDGWVSPRLGIRFDVLGEELRIYRPDGKLFISYTELDAQAEQARQQAEQARQQAEQARQQAETEHLRANTAEQQLDAERQRTEELRAKLRALGIDPDTLT